MGLFFSVAVKNMAALLPAIASAGLGFFCAYLEADGMSGHILIRHGFTLVGLLYLGGAGAYFYWASRQPDKSGRGILLLFTGLMALGGSYAINTMAWPLDL